MHAWEMGKIGGKVGGKTGKRSLAKCTFNGHVCVGAAAQLRLQLKPLSVCLSISPSPSLPPSPLSLSLCVPHHRVTHDEQKLTAMTACQLLA